MAQETKVVGKFIRIKEIPETAGEPKFRLDLAASAYFLGLAVRMTVYKWEITIDLGSAALGD